MCKKSDIFFQYVNMNKRNIFYDHMQYFNLYNKKKRNNNNFILNFLFHLYLLKILFITKSSETFIK